jgi:hypothetical protein
MTQALERLHCRQRERILCCHTNKTRFIQIIRIANVPEYYFERAVFPRENLQFEAYSDSWLEIYTNEYFSALLTDRILCIHLRVA